MSVAKIGFLAAAAAGMSLAGFARAATVNYGSGAVTISGDSDVSTNGTLNRAYSFGSAGGATVNGVTFSKFFGGTFNGDSTTMTSDAANAYAGGANPPYSNLSASYQALLAAGQYNDHTPATDTITLNNLTPNENYQVEFFVNDSRPLQRTETIDGVTVLYANSGNKGAVGQYLIGTFTADSASQVFNFAGQNYNGTQINALQLRDLGPASATPLPASAWGGLALLAGFGLTRLRRRTTAV